MALVTLWGNINANGSISSGSKGFTVTRITEGQYSISFQVEFAHTPAIVGSQTRWGSADQTTTDNIVFPFLDKGSAEALTGDADGKLEDRNFSFIAIGSDQ